MNLWFWIVHPCYFMIRLMSRQIHKSNCLFDRTNVGGGEVEAPGGFDHGGEDEAGEGVGFGGGLVNAGQKPKCPASRDHLFVFLLYCFSSSNPVHCCQFIGSLVHQVLQVKWNSTTPALISLPRALYTFPTVHNVH